MRADECNTNARMLAKISAPKRVLSDRWVGGWACVRVWAGARKYLFSLIANPKISVHVVVGDWVGGWMVGCGEGGDVGMYPKSPK